MLKDVVHIPVTVFKLFMYLSIVVVYVACIDSVSLFSAVHPWAVGGLVRE